jgi:hypothetical protein
MSDHYTADAARERLVADLADIAYPVALRHGAAPSVDVELEVWHAIDRALRPGAAWQRLLSPGRQRDQALAAASDAVYRVALRHGFKGSFLDLELGLWRALETARPAGTPVEAHAAAPRPQLPGFCRTATR